MALIQGQTTLVRQANRPAIVHTVFAKIQHSVENPQLKPFALLPRMDEICTKKRDLKPPYICAYIPQTFFSLPYESTEVSNSLTNIFSPRLNFGRHILNNKMTLV
jgi:hypothetical protein